MKKLVLAVIALSFSVCVNAACTVKDFAGVWNLYTTVNGITVRCTLVQPAIGTIYNSGSGCIAPSGATATFSSSFSVDKTCHVVGYFDIIGARYNMDAYIGKGKDSFAGMVWNESNNTMNGMMNGVKQ